MKAEASRPMFSSLGKSESCGGQSPLPGVGSAIRASSLNLKSPPKHDNLSLRERLSGASAVPLGQVVLARASREDLDKIKALGVPEMERMKWQTVVAGKDAENERLRAEIEKLRTGSKG